MLDDARSQVSRGFLRCSFCAQRLRHYTGAGASGWLCPGRDHEHTAELQMAQHVSASRSSADVPSEGRAVRWKTKVRVNDGRPPSAPEIPLNQAAELAHALQ